MIHDMPTKHHIYKETMYKKDIRQEANIKDLKMGHLLVLSTINFLLENHSSAYPSQSKISFIIGYSRRQVSRIIAELCRMRLMSKETFFNHETRINETCIYHIAGWLKTTEQKHAIKRRINALTFCKIRSWITRPAADVSRYILKVSTSIDISLLLGAVALQKRENWLRRFDIWPFHPPDRSRKNTTTTKPNCSTGRNLDDRYKCDVSNQKKKEYKDVQVSTECEWIEPIGCGTTGELSGEDGSVCSVGTQEQERYPETVCVSEWDMQAAYGEVDGSSESEEYNAITLFDT